MKVYLGERGLDQTHQASFPKTTTCCRCGGSNAVIAFVACEGREKKYICRLHQTTGAPSGAPRPAGATAAIDDGLWLHDACAVAVYFCRDCLEPTALYNQA